MVKTSEPVSMIMLIRCVMVTSFQRSIGEVHVNEVRVGRSGHHDGVVG